MRLLFALQRGKATIQTALDDIESFLWLLIWGIVYASKDIKGAKDNNPGISSMLIAWSGDVTYNLTKLIATEETWKDAVFGDLIQGWLDTFRGVCRENNRIVKNMFTMVGGPEWDRDKACNKLEDSSAKRQTS